MKKNIAIKAFFIVFLFFLNACQPAWTIKLDSSRLSTSFSQEKFQEIKKEYSESGNCKGIPLNVLLYRSGFEVIDSVILKNSRRGRYRS